MAKPVPRRIPSDDCTVTVDGVEYTPHEGEWVEAVALERIGDLRLMRELSELRVKLEALAGEDDERARRLAVLDDSFSHAAEMVGRRIVAWNWTDMTGRPLPQPSEQPSPLRDLSIEELYYLVQLVRGEGPSARGKDSSDSPTSSSDTAPTPSPAS